MTGFRGAARVTETMLFDRLFRRLAASAFRCRFRLGPRERAYLAQKGEAAILAHAREFIVARLAPAAPANDGKQTPMKGHPVFIAQHATATCCRTCLAKWHGIAAGKELTPSEQDYIAGIIGEWLRRDIDRG